MNTHDYKKNSPEVEKPQGAFYGDNCSAESGSELDQSSNPTKNWAADVEKTLRLGEQLVSFTGGIIGLARVEALLAVRTLPKLVMLWLLIMPVMLLAWCAFSALIGWFVFTASGQVGLGMLTFFLQQVLLLLICRWLFVRYRTRMTLPYTRAQINDFVRGIENEFNRRVKAKE